jgi:hypothetical protein
MGDERNSVHGEFFDDRETNSFNERELLSAARRGDL